MPEIKNSFLQGKMNKDLDERLLPNGQYRHAMNIEVSTSENSNVGVVKNILGNYSLAKFTNAGFNCVGSVADEKNNKLYWFVSKYDLDAIIEYDVSNDVVRPVLVDTYAGKFNAVLKFSGNIITGINIIDDLLFWTDNNSEPKKININECKKGTPLDAMDTNDYKHTQLTFENGSFNGYTIELISGSGDNVFPNSPLADGNRYVWYERKRLWAIFNEDFTDYEDVNNPGWLTDQFRNVRHYRNEKFLGIVEIKIFDNINGTHFRNVNDAHGDQTFAPGDIIFGNNIELDIEESHVTVIKSKPLNALSVKINHAESDVNTSNIPNLFETKFPRFSYRYKFKDGEYSAFAPFTTPVFNPKYPKDVSASIDTNIFYNKDTAYDIKEPYNKAMINSIHSIELSDFINTQLPEDVVEIDILYKQEESNVIYSIDTITNSDNAWYKISSHEGLKFKVNPDGSENYGANGYEATGGYTSGSFLVTTENIYAALPANQLLRPWDNVPKKALAQEVTGNRIVYGNYVQNYDLVNKAQISVSYSDRKNKLGSFTSQGLPSIKSQRNYQLGVIYCDKYGRETPVLTSKTGAITVPWQDSSGNKNASRSLQLNASVATNFPTWVNSLKFFIKENSNPYYNLTMDRAWVTEKTYELDDSEGHLYISFPSSDRNKISEEDYIILKKKIGAGEEQINFDNKYKVVDIKNEAPDAIKYRLVNQGVFVNTANNALSDPTAVPLNSLFYKRENRIDREVDTIVISHDKWKQGQCDLYGFRSALESSTAAFDNDKPPLETKDLYVSWRREGADNSVSKKYKVTGGWVGAGGYVIKLSTKITRRDADIAHIFGDSSQTVQPTSGVHASGGSDPRDPQYLHENLSFQVEKKELIESEDFSGKFFVKISKNQVTDIIQTGNVIDITKQYQVSSKASSFYWKDDLGDEIQTDNSNSQYGLTNHFGNNTSHGSGVDSIQGSTNNVVGDKDANQNFNQSGSLALKVSDYGEVWEGIQTRLGTHQTRAYSWFIDSMHMAAGQSDVSDYAKYCCVTWAGRDAILTGSNDSAWSYPPLKTWVTDFKDTSGMIISGDETIPAESVWYKNNLISTSPVLSTNSNYKGLKIDGWVGPLQNVSRHDHYSDAGSSLVNHRKMHINGLEGLVTTNDYHATKARRWFSGMNGSDHGVGIDTNTYSDNGEVGRHFLHLSFFAPGKNLHDNTWTTDNNGGDLFGDESWAANLQGIWGGGVFTGETPDDTFGTDSDKANQHTHLTMEWNGDSTNNILPEAPGPGVGWGYDTSKNYRELHERQWDPTFTDTGDTDNKIRDFIRNLYPGSKFRFHRTDTPGSTEAPALGSEVYTIKKVDIKKLYNHTSWRKPYNRYIAGGAGYFPDDGTEHRAYRSVEEAGLLWLDTCDANGVSSVGSGNAAGTFSKDPSRNEHHYFKQSIVNFGASHNRRLCYIIELDKNVEDQNFNPLADADIISANLDADKYCDIEFLNPIKDVLLSDLSKFPAIWELSPKKQEVDLDIYYEASGSIPVKINDSTNEIFAPIGCKVEVTGSNIAATSILTSWNGTTATLHPGLPKGDGAGNEIDYTEMLFKFIRQDGSYTIIEAGQQDLDGQSDGKKTEVVFRENIGDTITSGLSWHNCFSFGNGIESNRIKDDFNEPFISNGVKASTTTQEPYKEERRKGGLIYSGIYNPTSGINDLNQFIMAEKITKDINPTYGSVQKLFSRDTDLISFCEDKVVKILANKDALFNADGNTNLTATENVLGQTMPFVGEFGISTNPESFASESYRAYFTDKQRGAVLRLSKDGLTPISDAGMKDWFRDNLQGYNTLLGTYDSYKEDYNITLSNNTEFNENLILDSFLESGDAINNDEIGNLNIIENPAPNGGETLQYLYNNSSYNVLQYSNTSNPFNWDGFTQDDYDLKASVTVTHHAAIPYESLQEKVDAVNAVGSVANPTGTYEVTVTITNPNGSTSTVTVPPAGSATVYGSALEAENAANAAYPNATAITQGYVQASYATTVGLRDNGWWYDPGGNGGFMSVSGNLFGLSSSINHLADGQVYSDIHRHISGTSIIEQSNISYPHRSDYAGNASVAQNYSKFMSTSDLSSCSQAISRNLGANGIGTTGAIVFDRPKPENSWVEFRSIGSNNVPTNNGVNDDLASSAAGQSLLGNQLGDGHDTFFNGDELHIQFEIMCWPTFQSTTSNSEYKYGYNFVIPKIELFDGTVPLYNEDVIVVNPTLQSVAGTLDRYKYQQTTHADMLGDFEGEMLNRTDYSYPNDVNSDLVCIKSVSSSARVTFPDTQTATYNLSVAERTALGISAYTWQSQNPLANWYPSYTSERRSRTIRLGASFKFRDPVQQNADGSKKSGVNHIVAKKVVDDLRIRISNAKPTASSGWDQWKTPSGRSVLRQPLWELHKLFCKKGYGIVAPHVDEEITAYSAAVATQATPGYTAAVSYVAPVPPARIPAWSEVIHTNTFGFGNDTWSIDDSPSGQTASPVVYTHRMHSSQYGGNRAGTTSSGLKEDGTTIYYEEPNAAPAGSLAPPANISSKPGTTFNREGASNNIYTGTVTPHNNDYIIIEDHAASGKKVEIIKDITNDPWASNTWYLVDVEIDETYSTSSATPIPILDPSEYGSGGGPSGGFLRVRGVLPNSPSGYNYNYNISSSSSYSDNWVGAFSGGHFCKLVPTVRTKYGGAPKTVLRGIFKVTSNSYCMQTTARQNKFTIEAWGCQQGVKITKIITKKLSDPAAGSIWNNWIANNGQADDWNISLPSGQEAVHAFDTKYVYFGRANSSATSMLCFDVPSTALNISAVDDNYAWEQTFNPAPGVSPGQWELSFRVDDNPVVGGFAGELRGFAAITNTDAGQDHQGVYFSGITAPGDYSIKFNFDGNLDSEDDVTPPNTYQHFQRTPIGSSNIDGSFTGAIDTTENIFPQAGSNSVIADRIHFSGTGAGAQKYAISDIILTDRTPVYQGGTAASWNFSGFNTSLEDYIYWDSTGGGQLVFNDCPITDDNQEFININQLLTSTINRYEQYRVSFTHDLLPSPVANITSATLSIYYYNANGFGFEIPGVNHTFGDANGYYEHFVTIGDSIWDPINPDNNAYNSRLKNSFVIQVNGDIASGQKISGSIDNIKMLRVFATTDFEPTTVSFSEDVRGWTSFKSFVPENGVNISKKYFTFDDGNLYQHYVPLKKDTDGLWQKVALEEAENYNVFYENENASSSIQAVLNQEPSLVKTFNTINYEGSQAHVEQPVTPTYNGEVLKTASGGDYNSININNALAYGGDIAGWYCDQIKTDLDEGSIKEFIEKEGKWFNYIKGKLNIGTPDTSLFSVQGIGEINTINDITPASDVVDNGGAIAVSDAVVVPPVDAAIGGGNGAEGGGAPISVGTPGGTGGGGGY